MRGFLRRFGLGRSALVATAAMALVLSVPVAGASTAASPGSDDVAPQAATITASPTTGLASGGVVSTSPCCSVTGTPTITVTATGGLGYGYGTCSTGQGSSWPPATVADCDFEGVALAGGGPADGSPHATVLLPFVCPGDPVPTGAYQSGRVALAVGHVNNGANAIEDYVELTYDCSAPPPVTCPTGSTTSAGTATPGAVTPGSTTTFSGSGFAPGAAIDLTLCSSPTPAGTTTADGSGAFSTIVTIPPGAELGTHTLVATGEGRAGTHAVTASVQVAGTATIRFTG